MRHFNRSHWNLLVGSLMLAALVVQYNACSKVEFRSDMQKGSIDMLSISNILINDGALFTNSRNVSVFVENKSANEVYLTNDQTCSTGGAWLPMQESGQNKYPWSLTGANAELKVYAQFRNTESGMVSDCVSDDIVHDDQPPKIDLVKPDIVTNSLAPNFAFSAFDSLSGLKRVTCEWPGQPPIECAFSATASNFPEGDHLIKVVAEDAAGNVSLPTVQHIIIDRTKPLVTVNSAPSALSADANPQFAFSAQDDRSGVESLECSKEDQTRFAPCTSPNQFAAAEGAHHFYIRARDLAGNVSDVKEIDYAIDTQAPTVRILSGPNGHSNVPTASFTFDGTDNGQPITKFECRTDVEPFSACTSPRTASGLSEGSHTFEVRGVDNAGNFSSPASRTWMIDLSAPTVTLTQTPPAIGNGTSAEFRYTVVDSGSGIASVQCSLDGVAIANCDPAKHVTSGTLSEGSHTFQVHATDLAGNQGSSALYTWKVDRTLPVLTVTKRPADFSNSPEADFEFTANDDGEIDRVECKLDSGIYTACDSLTAHAISGLSQGSHREAIRAVDKAGNVSKDALVDWMVDLTSPVIVFDLEPVAVVQGSNQSLKFTASDAGGSGLASVKCLLNGSSVACMSGSLISLNGLAPGNYDFRVVARDNAGNETTEDRAFETATPPPAPKLAVTADPNIVIKGQSTKLTVASENIASLSYQCVVRADSSIANEGTIDPASPSVDVPVSKDIRCTVSGGGLQAYVDIDVDCANQIKEGGSCRDFKCDQVKTLALSDLQAVPARTSANTCYAIKVMNAIPSSLSSLTTVRDSEVITANHDSSVPPTHNPYVLGKFQNIVKILGPRVVKVTGGLDASAYLRVDNFFLSGFYPSQTGAPANLTDAYTATGSYDSAFVDASGFRGVTFKSQRLPIIATANISTSPVPPIDVTAVITPNVPYWIDLRMLDCGQVREMTDVYLLFQ